MDEELAFPGTDDGRTVAEVDAYIKAENTAWPEESGRVLTLADSETDLEGEARPEAAAMADTKSKAQMLADECATGYPLADDAIDAAAELRRLDRTANDLWADYQRLTAERDALRAEVERLRAAPAPVAKRREPPGGWVFDYNALRQDRDALLRRVSYLETAASEGGAWIWQGDGEDHPESMVDSLPVIIRADQLRALIAAPTPVAQRLTKEALTDIIADGLRDTYHCTRVWSAWGYGTMSADDFEPVDASETPSELANAILAAIEATGQEGGAA